MMEVIEKLYDGTAQETDVYRALGWEIRPHGSWWRRLGKYSPDQGLSGLSDLTNNARDALLCLIDPSYKEVAVREAMALNHKFTGLRCPIARRICVIALTRPEFQSEFARP